jgi:NitT/TauT family transport system ATP-binding protein
MLEPKITLRNVRKRFTPKNDWVLDSISLDVQREEILGLMGPSGCGKTTLLRLIADLLPPSAGEISRRPDGNGRLFNCMVFQDLALFPWKTVSQNVALGRQFQDRGQPGLQEATKEVLRRMRLSGCDSHYPSELSGGMKQRVALARAFLSDPEVLLMDEPFGSLDAATRRLLQEELLRFQEEHRTTVVLVTHSIEEAIRLCDRIVLLSAAPGRIIGEITIPFTRPREISLLRDPRFADISRDIWERLSQAASL